LPSRASSSKIKPDDLSDTCRACVKARPKTAFGQRRHPAAARPGEASGAIAPAAMGKQEALKKFTTDLTEQARGGKMDPIVGRDDEIRQVVDILMRRRQNNPILVGEAGVGKTAVVEGFAQRIARGDVPPALKDVEAADAGRGPAAGRRQHEGRVRAAPALGDRRSAGQPASPSSCSSTRRTRWWAPAARPAPAMRPTCSSRRWRAARCAPSAPPPLPNTRSTSKRTRR
jgi:type VI secretion system protein VasG